MAAAGTEAKPSLSQSKSSKRWSALKGIAHANAVVKTIPHGIDSETFLGDSIPAAVRCVRNLQCSSKFALPCPQFMQGHTAAGPPFLRSTTFLTIEQSLRMLLRIFKCVWHHHSCWVPSSCCAQKPLESLGKPSTASTTDDSLAQATNSAAYTGVLIMLQAAIRHRTKLSIIQGDLAKMNAPEAFVADFVNVLRRMCVPAFPTPASARTHIQRFFRRASLEESTAELGTRFPGLAELRWRVDVTISTSEAKRVMQPSILMQMALTNGQQHTFDMPVAQFHKLRYNVAKVSHHCHLRRAPTAHFTHSCADAARNGRNSIAPCYAAGV